MWSLELEINSVCSVAPVEDDELGPEVPVDVVDPEQADEQEDGVTGEHHPGTWDTIDTSVGPILTF